MSNKEASMTWETLISLYQSDYRRSWSVWREIERRWDVTGPMPGFSQEASALIGFPSEEIDDQWRRVRSAYQGVRAQYEILDERHPFFREALTESEFPTPFLYALGNVALLDREKVTVLGALAPSEEAEGDILDASAFLSAHKLCLMTPLSIGVPSLMMGEVLKSTGAVIAVSDQFVSKAPNERLMAQMVDIMKRGGLILSPFGPASRPEKWHQVIRNRALSALSDRLLVIDEKDGGPSWRIFDEAQGDGVVKMCSVRMIGRENYSFIAERIGNGALPFERAKDLRALLPKRERRRHKWEDEETPDLFDLP